MKILMNFFSFVEIRTKTASLVPFLTGAGYTFYRLGALDRNKTVLFFIAMELFDMTATAINNHIGTRQQQIKNHYKTSVSLAVILTMLTGAAGLGIYLTTITGPVVLLTGIFCFGIGIFYSFGPLPIAATPFGELFSGGVQGLLIPFLIYAVNDPDILIIELARSQLYVTADIWGLAGIAVLGLPLVCCISNIMLANNLCDVEEDVSVKRFTLPFYIGQDNSLKLFQILYIAAYVFIIAGVVFGILPIATLLVVFTIIPVGKNVRAFLAEQDKKRTFQIAIINFLLITLPYAAGIWLVQVGQLWFG